MSNSNKGVFATNSKDVYMNKNPMPFYKNQTFILVLLLLMPPVGIVLMWAYMDKKEEIKRLLTVLFFLLFIGYVVLAFRAFDSDNQQNVQAMPKGSSVSKIDDTWGLYDKNESLIEDYNGLAENENGTWLITNGYVDFGFTGKYFSNGNTYDIDGGKVVG